MKKEKCNFRENLLKEIIDKILILVTINELSNKEFINIFSVLCNMNLGNKTDNYLLINHIEHIFKIKKEKYMNECINEQLETMHSPYNLPVFSVIK